MSADENKLKKRNYIMMAAAFVGLIIFNQFGGGESQNSEEQNVGIFTQAPKPDDKDIPEGNHIKMETEKGRTEERSEGKEGGARGAKYHEEEKE